MANNNVLLIDPNFVRSTTNISNNLNDKYLQSAIREATDIDLEEVYGTKLLNKVKDLVVTGEIKNEENKQYKELLNASKYFLTYSVIARIVVISSAKLDNFGVSQADDEHINSLDMKEIFQLEKYYTNKADAYKLRLQNFISKNKNSYPELCHDCYDIEPNLSTAASCSIFLGGERGKVKYQHSKTYGDDYYESLRNC